MILVVEDDPQVSRLIALVLQRGGYESLVISDGHAALEAARAKQPSIIFADLSLEGMGGEQLCRRLKAQAATKQIPYIVVSGDRDVAEKAHLCGADDYMGKPFEFDDLIRLVRKYAGTESRKAD